jgi:hypothetical protein
MVMVRQQRLVLLRHLLQLVLKLQFELIQQRIIKLGRRLIQVRQWQQLQQLVERLLELLPQPELEPKPFLNYPLLNKLKLKLKHKLKQVPKQHQPLLAHHNHQLPKCKL